MTFPTVIFGSASITAPDTFTFTDRDSIPSGGFILYIVPTKNVGASGIDIGFTYVNQFGVTKTTTVSTAIEAGTTAGTHIRVVLEPGDTGIRDLIGISYFVGGTAGDELNFESWNEGLGSPPFDVVKTDIHDRQLPGQYLPEPYPAQYIGNIHTPSYVIPDMYYENPAIPIPIELTTTTDILEFLPEIIDRFISSVEENVYRRDQIEWISEPTLRDFLSMAFPVLKSWLESIVGQVVSGYVTNMNDEAILNAIRLIITSSEQENIDPSTASSTGIVDPATGLYQTFIKNMVYDKRWIIIQIAPGKVTALEKGGTPDVIDGRQEVPIPYNLQFTCPYIECDFELTRKQ